MTDKEYLASKAEGQEVAKILKFIQDKGYHLTGFDKGIIAKTLIDATRVSA